MRLKQLFADDNAVSPVIGVILMVAITVILAAVIASFVLGLGDSAENVQPNTNFNSEYEEKSGLTGDGYLNITISDGDEIEVGNLILRGDGVTSASGGELTLGPSDISAANQGIGGYDPSSASATTQLSAGQGVAVEVSSDYEADLVWETSEDSKTLDSFEGPDA